MNPVNTSEDHQSNIKDKDMEEKPAGKEDIMQRTGRHVTSFMKEYPPLKLPILHQDVEGFSYPIHCGNILDKNIFTPRHDDCMVVTFPRSGTTWTLELLRSIHLIQNPPENPLHPLRTLNHQVSAPWINLPRHRVGNLDNKPSPRIMKSHNQYQHLNILPDNKTFRIVHVMREPRDVACSSYHHIQAINHFFGYMGTWKEYQEHFLEGKMESGDYWRFNEQYLDNKHGFNILYLIYEQMQADKRDTIKTLNNFLGYEKLSDQQIDTILDATKFENMKGTQKSLNDNIKVLNGISGGYKNQLDDGVSKFYAEKTENILGRFSDRLPHSYFE